MTPHKKAQQLVNCYLKASFNCKDCITPYCDMQCTKLSIREAKECALITVDEILKSFERFMDIPKSFRNELEIDAERYWLAVKVEIEKL